MISTIFFDVGGTLIHPDLDRLMAPLLARVTPTAQQLTVAERAAKYADARNGDDDAPADASGKINRGHWEVYFDALLKEVGCCHDLLPELTARAGNSSFWTLVDPAAPATLSALRRDYRLGIISNADGRIRQVLEQAGLLDYFQAVIDSGVVGHEKPDARIFRAAIDAMKARPEDCLYIGDIYSIDYRGATAAGMHAIIVDPTGVYCDWNVPRIGSLAELPAWIKRQE